MINNEWFSNKLYNFTYTNQDFTTNNNTIPSLASIHNLLYYVLSSFQKAPVRRFPVISKQTFLCTSKLYLPVCLIIQKACVSLRPFKD